MDPSNSTTGPIEKSSEVAALPPPLPSGIAAVEKKSTNIEENSGSSPSPKPLRSLLLTSVFVALVASGWSMWPKSVMLEVPPKHILDSGSVGKLLQIKLGTTIMRFCYCPSGSFTMGSPTTEVGRGEDENQVDVEISKGFWLAQTECTQEQWLAVMSRLPDFASKTGDNMPVEFVTWNDAAAFVARVNKEFKDASGWKFALPTEAQWEYACRAGTLGAYAGSLDSLAWHQQADGANTHAVGSKMANNWGFMDMHGNMLEWCFDWYSAIRESGTDPMGPPSGNSKVLRSGIWWLSRGIRSASRYSAGSTQQFGGNGFRLALVPEELLYVSSPSLAHTQAIVAPPQTNVNMPRNATKAISFENSLGMKFVPVVNYQDGKVVLFSIWETRRQDYAAYAVANNGVDNSWKSQLYKGFPVGQAENHPVVGVTWKDAIEFCAWLTFTEREAGRIKHQDEYRLPTDVEWSFAVGIGEQEDASATPEEKDGKLKGVYPWGNAYPPPSYSGNYADDSAIGRLGYATMIEGYKDGYATTSPVGSYNANNYGVYDLGGNVWEWCQDWYSSKQQYRVFRGGSWAIDNQDSLLSSCRIGMLGSDERHFNIGFRCVLAVDAGK